MNKLNQNLSRVKPAQDTPDDLFIQEYQTLDLPSDTPFYFGDSNELYGFCRVPKNIIAHKGVLFCYPIGDEYIKSHRFFRDLSDMLVQKGMAVFKFDYLGTGDSLGDCQDWDLEVWTNNIATALQELKKRTGVLKVYVVACGLGAVLAATTMKKSEVKADKLILLDPVTSGSNYLAKLKKIHKNLLEGQKKIYPFPEDRDLMIDPNEINGFYYKPELQAAIRACTLVDFDKEVGGNVEVIHSTKAIGFNSVYSQATVYGQVKEKRRILNTITSSLCGEL